MAKRVAIIGGGITGLVAALSLEQDTQAEIDLYEASPVLGGKLQTEHRDPFLVERGPDCFFSLKPGVMELVEELGLEDQLIQPQAKAFAMLIGGRLHTVPAGLVTLSSVHAEAVWAADFLSEETKRRVLAEPEQPRGTADDESIREFFERRFGAEFTRLVAEPLLAGTHGGDAGNLSMRALYPGYLALERQKGSLSSEVPAASGKPSFLSFRDGMGTLVQALQHRLSRTRVHLNHACEVLPEADEVLVAVPANRAAGLLPGCGLERIEHRSSSIATFAFRAEDVELQLNHTGFLVPSSEPSTITGATWSSAKWKGRAPESTVLLRVFMRQETDALAAVRPLLGITGNPIFSRVDHWMDALPQYTVGHLDKLAEIESLLPAYVTLAGTSYRGVGVPDCLRQGRDAARKIAESL